MAENLLPFRISSGLKNIIGRDLITDDQIAMFELVKNAYDAGATQVVIEFLEDKIIIEDDGKGMTKEDIVNKWLHVAYSAKKEGTEDDDKPEDYRDKIQLKRFYAGAKGIGRFSCDKLGNKLTMTTRKKGGSASEEIRVNWEEFEKDPQKEFINIKVRHETIVSEQKFAGDKPYGTRLNIRLLNEPWDRAKKLKLKKSLAKLINPIDSDRAKLLEADFPSFSIVVKDDRELEQDLKTIEKYNKVNGEVENFVFEKLKLKTSHITATIDELGKGITIKLEDRGTLIYKIRKTNRTGLSNIIFHLFFLNQTAKTNFTQTVGIRPIDFGSIYLYKNGFRIAPFGDPGDDSFKIERKKGQRGGRTFGLRDLIGRIEIFGDPNHEKFKETTSRNGGFIKNKFTEELEDCFHELCISKLEDYVFNIARQTEYDDKNLEDTRHLETLKSQTDLLKLIKKEMVDKETEALENIDKNLLTIKAQALSAATKEAIDNLRFIAEKLEDDSFLKTATATSAEYERIKKLENQLAEETAARKAEEDAKRKAEDALKIEQEKNTYLLATRRTMSKDADGLIHNIKFTSTKIRAIVDNLIEDIQNGVATEKQILQNLGKIRTFADKALKISELITRANFKTNTQTQVVDLVKFTEQYFTLFGEIFSKEKLQFEVVTNGTALERRIGVLDLSIVFDNFIFNAEKAGASKVLAECFQPTPATLTIRISDDGRGVEPQFIENPEKMFDLGVTTTDGSGIGLFTIKENLRAIHANTKFVGNNLSLAGATFEINFQ